MPYVLQPSWGWLHDGNYTQEEIDELYRCCGGAHQAFTKPHREKAPKTEGKEPEK